MRTDKERQDWTTNAWTHSIFSGLVCGVIMGITMKSYGGVALLPTILAFYYLIARRNLGFLRLQQAIATAIMLLIGLNWECSFG
ncbi:hypothetical protein LLG46_10410 [bacterium]|nr:hypothetical protein [bacterium]